MMIALLLLGLAVVFFAVLFALYRFTFSYPPKKRIDPHQIPQDGTYRPVTALMQKAMKDMDELPYEEVSIRSEDGYMLYGRYYRQYPGRPTEIFFHGYHGTAMWDGYGCFQFCRQHKHNILMVEVRSHGRSESHTITFGIQERFDCLCWAKYIAEQIGPDADMILSGVSMGAATVMMASELPLPSNVKAVIADCGYTSPKAILKSFAENTCIPATAGYILLKLGAKLFGGFDLEACSAIEAVQQTAIPIMFIHGDQDQVVPFSMCGELFDACASAKRRLTVAGAGHAVNAMADFEAYDREISAFLAEAGVEI